MRKCLLSQILMIYVSVYCRRRSAHFPNFSAAPRFSANMLLENDQFLSELSRFFQKSRSSGSVWITMKRWDGKSKPDPKSRKNVPKSVPAPAGQPSTPAVHEFKCLFRAVLGSKKLSTIVNQKDVNKFQLAYANVIKSNVDNLKKREKSTKNNAVAAGAKKSKVEG